MKKFNLYRFIPLTALVIVVWFNASLLHKGLSGGWEKVAQLINQRDMRLVALLISQHLPDCQKINEEQLDQFIDSHLDPKQRLMGFYPMSKDVWGQSYKIRIAPTQILIRSSGPDQIVQTDDDAQFLLPLRRNIQGEALSP